MSIDVIEIFSLFMIVISLGCMVYINILTAEEEDDSI